MWKLYGALLVVVGSASVHSRGPAAAPVPRDELWKSFVQDCVHPVATGDPTKCASGEGPAAMQVGYIVYKDTKSPTHFLLIPTIPVSGIESPYVLDPTAPNYWQGAWLGRTQVGNILQKTLARNMTAYAANPPFARTQDQLHIHIDCVRPDIEPLLKSLKSGDLSTWNPVSIDVVRKGVPLTFTYRFRFVAGEDMSHLRPFEILNEALQSEPGSLPIRNHTLVALGTTVAGQDGFFLLEASSEDTDPNPVHGEDLLDPNCTIVGPH